MLGQIITVTVDRPLGSTHPKHKNIVYPIYATVGSNQQALET
jgi:hypothetical protein